MLTINAEIKSDGKKVDGTLNKEREARTKKLLQQGKRVPSNRSLSLYLVSIKKLFNEAKKKYNRKEKNLILIAHSPFDDFTIPKGTTTANIRLFELLICYYIKK